MTSVDLLESEASLCTPTLSHILLQTPPHVTHLPTSPHTRVGVQEWPKGDTCTQDRPPWRPVTAPPRCHRLYKKIRRPVSNEVECPMEVWPESVESRPLPGLQITLSYSSSGHAQPRVTSPRVPALQLARPGHRSTSCVTIGQRAGPRPIFLESSWKSVKGVSFREAYSPRSESRRPCPSPSVVWPH